MVYMVRVRPSAEMGAILDESLGEDRTAKKVLIRQLQSMCSEEMSFTRLVGRVSFMLWRSHDDAIRSTDPATFARLISGPVDEPSEQLA